MREVLESNQPSKIWSRACRLGQQLMEAYTRIELVLSALQADAFPLGEQAIPVISRFFHQAPKGCRLGHIKSTGQRYRIRTCDTSSQTTHDAASLISGSDC